MAKKPANEVAVRQNTSVGMTNEFMAQMAAEAKKVTAVETPSSNTLSFKSGVLAVGGQPVGPHNSLSVIVVGAVFENAWYASKYDPNKLKSPECFALSPTGLDMAPHDNVPEPVNDTCEGCPNMEWGSAGEGRKGKACKEIRRIAVIPADKIESVDDLLSAEVATGKVPVTSVANWSNFVHTVSAKHNMPYWAAVCTLRVAPHIRNQFEVTFELEDIIEDMPMLMALKKKVESVGQALMAPYSPNEEEEEAPAPAQPAKKRKF